MFCNRHQNQNVFAAILNAIAECFCTQCKNKGDKLEKSYFWFAAFGHILRLL